MTSDLGRMCHNQLLSPIGTVTDPNGFCRNFRSSDLFHRPPTYFGGNGKFKGRHFDRSVILLRVRWYLAHGLSLRNPEEMMAERGISVDHCTIHCWVLRFSPKLLKSFNLHKWAVTKKWHVDESRSLASGCISYLAIDSLGDGLILHINKARCRGPARRRRLAARRCRLRNRESDGTKMPTLLKRWDRTK